MAKIPKPLVSVKVQLLGPGDPGMSCDLGLASPERPFLGPDAPGQEMGQASQAAVQLLPKKMLVLMLKTVVGSPLTCYTVVGQDKSLSHPPWPLPSPLLM